MNTEESVHFEVLKSLKVSIGTRVSLPECEHLLNLQNGE